MAESPPPPQKGRVPWFVWLAAGAVVVAIIIRAFGGLYIPGVNVFPSDSRSLPAAASETVVIAATEAGTVNVWNDYQTRARVVDQVAPGTRVQLLRRDGNGRLIRTPSGAEGWVSKEFLVGE